jgi:hypothetical protein
MMDERGMAVGLVERRETEGPTRSEAEASGVDAEDEAEAAGVGGVDAAAAADADEDEDVLDVACVEDIEPELETCRAWCRRA